MTAAPLVRYSLRVALRGEDLAAISAFEALHERMGAHDLVSLERETVWGVELPAAGVEAAARARTALETIARETLLFANPVKERWRIEEGSLALPGAPGRAVVGLLVRDRPDRAGESRAGALRDTHGLAGARVSRATLWVLGLAGIARDAALARAHELGVTTARRAGLLVNPHFQDFEFVVSE
ncbi:MAG: hypothetical protein ACKVU1_03745 [bacterium]